MNKDELLSRGTLVTDLDTAVVVFPIQAELSDIVRFFETSFGQFQFGDSSDDLIVKAQLRDGIEILVTEDSLKYDIPMDLEIVQRTFLGSIDAKGSILLSMQSKYDIDSAWTVVTSTQVLNHEWIEEPKANVSLIRLSIASLSDRLIAKNKEQLAANIDTQIANSLNLRQSIQDIWQRLKSPLEVSEDYKVWLQLKPIDLSLSRIYQDDQNITAFIKARVTPKVSVGNRPSDFALDTIPEFDWQPIDTLRDNSGYLVPIRLTIPDSEIEDLANDFLKEEVYDLGKKKVRVKDIQIGRLDNAWNVEMTIFGDVNGVITMTGIPKYDRRKEEVYLDDFGYTVDSKNLILKSSALLFKQKIEKRLLAQINSLILAKKKELLDAIDEQLLKSNKNQWLDIHNEIDHLVIYDLGLEANGMWVYILLNGECKANFKFQESSP